MANRALEEPQPPPQPEPPPGPEPPPPDIHSAQFIGSFETVEAEKPKPPPKPEPKPRPPIHAAGFIGRFDD